LIAANADASYRKLAEANSWHAWWPEGQGTKTSNNFTFKKKQYSLKQKAFNSFLIGIKEQNDSLSSQFLFVPINKDSISLQWKTELLVASNFIEKIRQYFDAKTLQKDMGHILISLKPFLEKKENLYDVEIKEEKVKDTVLLASRMVSNSYPTNSEIYSLAHKIETYIQSKGGKQTDYPR
jgi:hypothetical protein